ncbi:phage major capsid protein [Micromonospora sp. DT62]|uniref:phage major capsid protein n=1 Tax=Micromonospora sp. DT62 TaxID=3416521 RepID=UPI003CF6ADAF
MSEIANRLRERRNNVWEQAKGLADRVADENRNFTGEEQRQWDELNAELDGIDSRIKSVIEGEKRAQDTEAEFARFRGEPKRQESRGQESAELRSVLLGEVGAARTYTVRPEGQVDYRDLLKGTAASGGNTVPTSFYHRLMVHAVESSGVLQAGPFILNTSSGENLEIPKTTAHSTATLVGEAAAIPESDPTFGKVTLGAYKYGLLLQVSRELASDTGVDLEGYLAKQAGQALGRKFGEHLVSGTGTNQPRGLMTDATVGVTGPTGTATGFGTQNTVGQGGDLLIDLYHSVISPYRASPSCGWLMRDSTAAALRKLKNSQGDYIWQPSLVAGQPDTILGKPVFIDPNMPAVGAGNKSILFGDLSAYFVRLVGGVEFVRSDEYAFNTDMITYRAIMRGDAALVDLTGAVKVFQHSAT